MRPRSFSPERKRRRCPFREASFAIAPPSSSSENLREKRDFDPIIKQAGQEYGVDPYLIKAVIQTESSGKPRSRLFGRRPGVDAAHAEDGRRLRGLRFF